MAAVSAKIGARIHTTYEALIK